MMLDTAAFLSIKPCIYYNMNYDSSFSMRLHRHDSLEIMYAISGTFILEYLDEKSTPSPVSKTIESGQFILIKPGLAHKLAIPDRAEARILNVELESGIENASIEALICRVLPFSQNRFADQLFKDFKDVLVFEDTQNLLQTLLKMQNDLSADLPDNEFELSWALLIARFWTELIRCRYSTSDRIGNIYVKKALTYINMNLHRYFSIAELCDSVQVSHTYLERLFRQTFGMTVFQKCNELRIHKACLLLNTSNASTQAISKTVGFNNYQSFVNSFHKYAHTTPLLYRTQAKNEYRQIHAYDYTYFDEKFNRFYELNKNAAIYSASFDEAVSDSFFNIIVLRDTDINRYADKIKYCGKLCLFALSGKYSQFEKLKNDLKKADLFHSVLGFILVDHISENIEELFKIFYEKRFWIPYERYETLSSKHKKFVTDLIFDGENEEMPETKKNIWLSKNIGDIAEAHEFPHLKASKNYGGIIFSVI